MTEGFLRLVDRIFWDRGSAPAADSEVALWRVMNLGDWATIRAMERAVPRGRLVAVLRAAPAGALSARSRRLWQVRLGVADLPQDDRRTIETAVAALGDLPEPPPTRPIGSPE